MRDRYDGVLAACGDFRSLTITRDPSEVILQSAGTFADVFSHRVLKVNSSIGLNDQFIALPPVPYISDDT
ncbi:MAG: hypothetical protein QXI32_05555 [Candidatus Bathyarchaeia archaeon]